MGWGVIRTIAGSLLVSSDRVLARVHWALAPFGVQWQRYWEGAPYPDLVKTIAHVAFEVENLEEALVGHEVIIPPNSPSHGVVVAFIKVAGAPVKLLQIDRSRRKDL